MRGDPHVRFLGDSSATRHGSKPLIRASRYTQSKFRKKISKAFTESLGRSWLKFFNLERI
jgi:hypothetical protein